MPSPKRQSTHLNPLLSYPSKAFRVDEDRLLDVFPDGPPRELFESASAAMAGAGFPGGMAAHAHPLMAASFPFGPGVETGDISGVNVEAMVEVLSSLPQLVGAMEQGMGASARRRHRIVGA